MHAKFKCNVHTPVNPWHCKCENASGKRDVWYSSTESALVNDAALLIIIVQCTEHSMRTATSQHTSSAGCFYLTLTREMNPAPLYLLSQPSPRPAEVAAPKLGWFPFRGLTVLVLWWCRCEETPNAGNAEEATAPLLRDRRRTDLHTFAAISGVKPGRKNASAAGEPTETVEEREGK